MKNLKTLGKVLSSNEQKQVNGGDRQPFAGQVLFNKCKTTNDCEPDQVCNYFRCLAI